MKPKYEEWIKANVNGTGYGKCHEVATKMAAAFPELRYARGFYRSIDWGQRQHGWCVDITSGEIVDPTASQFPCGGIAQCYDELVGTDKEIADRLPSGVCMDCGREVYGGATFCNATCEAATLAYLEDPRSNAEKDDDYE